MIKQKYTGKAIGGVIDSVSRAAIILNGIMLVSNLLILYSTTVVKYTPWISFTVYAACLSVIILIILYVAWRYILPSAYGFYNHQVWNHDNPIRRAIEAIFKYVGIPRTKDMKNPEVNPSKGLSIDERLEILHRDNELILQHLGINNEER